MFPLNSIVTDYMIVCGIVINLLLTTNYKIKLTTIDIILLYVYRGVTKKKCGPLKYCLGKYISYLN